MELSTTDKTESVAIISCETGEILNTIYQGDSLSIKRKEQKEYCATHEMNFNKGATFVKMYTEVIKILTNKLSPKEFQLIMFLSDYIDYETCILKIGYGNGRHNMSIKEISEESKTEYSRTTRLINSLINKGLIGDFKIGNINNPVAKHTYIVNPYIFINGKNPLKQVTNYFFNHTGWNDLIGQD